MKKILIALLFFGSLSYGQTKGISYQALIIDPIEQELPGFNNNQAPLANKNICLKFSFIDELNSLEYEEIFTTTTDDVGMVNLIIGTEDRTGGYASSFEDITWSSLPKNLKVDLPLEVSMIFANTKNLDEQKKFKVLLEKILGERYDIILLNSTKTSNKEAEDKVSKEIAKAKRNNKRVIILTKDMGSRSFGISEVDTIFLLFDGGDVGVVSQKISRVLTPGKSYNGEKKSVGNVVSLSLDPNRDSSPVDEYILKESEKVEEEDLNESIRKVLRSINLFSNETGLIKSLDTDEYYNELIESSSLLSVGASAVKTYNVPEDVDLDGVKIYKESRKKQKGIDRNKVVTYEQDGETVTDSEEIKKIEKDIKNKLRSIVYKTTDFSEINNIESDNYIEMMENIKNKGYDSEVEYEIGLGCDDVIKLCESDSIPVKLMNTILTSYNKLENNYNKA